MGQCLGRPSRLCGGRSKVVPLGVGGNGGAQGGGSGGKRSRGGAQGSGSCSSGGKESGNGVHGSGSGGKDVFCIYEVESGEKIHVVDGCRVAEKLPEVVESPVAVAGSVIDPSQVVQQRCPENVVPVKDCTEKNATQVNIGDTVVVAKSQDVVPKSQDVCAVVPKLQEVVVKSQDVATKTQEVAAELPAAGVIQVQPAASDANFSLVINKTAANNSAMGAAWPKLDHVTSSINRPMACVYKCVGPEGTSVVVKKEWDVQRLRQLVNSTEAIKEGEKMAIENKGFIKTVFNEDDDETEDNEGVKRIERGHLVNVGLKQDIDVDLTVKGAATKSMKSRANASFAPQSEVHGDDGKSEKGSEEMDLSVVGLGLQTKKNKVKLPKMRIEPVVEKGGSSQSTFTNDEWAVELLKETPRKKLLAMDETAMNENCANKIKAVVEPSRAGPSTEKSSGNHLDVVATAKETRPSSSRKSKASRTISLLVGKQLFGGLMLEEPGVRKSKHEDVVKVKHCTLGISDEEYWLEGHRELSKEQRAEIARKLNIRGKNDDRHLRRKYKKQGVARSNSQFFDVKDKPSTSSEVSRNDVKTQMKNIDSEITALLRPDEKKMAIVFTIKNDDRERSRTPGVAPRRLATKQKPEVDQAKILEKQKEAEKRRKENIAKRIQSVRRQCSNKVEDSREGEVKKHAKTMERIGAAIARRDEIMMQKKEMAQRFGKKDIVERQEMERERVKNEVLIKGEAAIQRKNEILEKKVQSAIKVGQRKQCFVQETTTDKDHVLMAKCDAATRRRDAMMTRRMDHAKKTGASRAEVVYERLVTTASQQQRHIDCKMRTFEDNRERALRKTVQWNIEQDRKRELVRRKVARMKRQDEEELQDCIEMELDTFEESDSEEIVWN